MNHVTRILGAAAVILASLPGLALAGEKQICNQSSLPITVQLTPRLGSNPGDGDLAIVGASLAANSCTSVIYSGSTDPYLNDFKVLVRVGKSFVAHGMSVGKNDRSGLVDQALNLNSKVDINVNTNGYSIAMAWHN